jgi:hypothetical protein
LSTVAQDKSEHEKIVISTYDSNGKLIRESDVSDIVNPKVGLDIDNSSSSGKGSSN